MNNNDKLPIIVPETVRDNQYVMPRLAQEAFRLANYDMTPDNPVNTAIQRGLIIVEKPQQPAKIKRMPGNGSFA